MTMHDPNPDLLIYWVYAIILFYFVIGGIGFYLINRKRPRVQARSSYTKYLTYFVIVHILFASIVILPVLFRFVAVVIVVVGGIEFSRLWVSSGFRYPGFYSISLVIFLICGLGFLFFSTLPAHYVLYVFLIVFLFDSFCQIAGQLWGKTKITPRVSPNKTVEGLAGGVFVATISAFLLKSLYPMDFLQWLIFVGGIIGMAFAGDLLASIYKRKYGVKDYSRLIPGHGGMLDRFDSLIAAGAWAALFAVWIQ